MTEIVRTANSEYEFDHENLLCRRVSGSNPPTAKFTPDGEWRPYAKKEIIFGFLVVHWPNGSFTRTSPLA